jgi:hypothetical protein
MEEVEERLEKGKKVNEDCRWTYVNFNSFWCWHVLTYPKSWSEFEGFPTNKALIWTCTAMTPHVHTHPLFVTERLITMGTSEHPTAMAPHMDPQRKITFQPLATLLALLSFTFCHMWIQVSFQYSLSWKCFGTYMTHIFTHSVMYISLMSRCTSLGGKPTDKNLSRR